MDPLKAYVFAEMERITDNAIAALNPEFQNLEGIENGEEDAGLRDPWWTQAWTENASKQREQAEVLSQTTTTEGIQWPDTGGYGSGTTTLGNCAVSGWYPTPYCTCNHQTKDAFNVARLLIDKGYADIKSAKAFIQLVEDLKKVL